MNIDEITLETFTTSIERIISCLNEAKENSLIKVNKEAIIHLMHKGFTYYKSAPVINLLISMKNFKDNDLTYSNEDLLDETFKENPFEDKK